MIKLDLEKMLDSMGKEAILAQISTQIDTAIAQKVEREREIKDRAFNAARERVAQDTYTQDDIDVLLDHLKFRMSARKETMSTSTIAPKAKNRVVSSGELDDVMRALFGDGGYFVK